MIGLARPPSYIPIRTPSLTPTHHGVMEAVQLSSTPGPGSGSFIIQLTGTGNLPSTCDRPKGAVSRPLSAHHNWISDPVAKKNALSTSCTDKTQTNARQKRRWPPTRVNDNHPGSIISSSQRGPGAIYALGIKGPITLCSYAGPPLELLVAGIASRRDAR